MKKYFILLPSIIFVFSCGNGNGESKKEDADSTSERKSEQGMSHEEREMMEMMEKQKNAKPQENPYKNAKIDVRVFKNDTVKPETKYTGYGYDISINGENYNHQPHKPGIPGISGFKSVDDAKKTGEFVAYKIRNNIMPPSITFEELDSLGGLNSLLNIRR